MLMCSCEKGDFNLTPRTVARLVLEAGQEHRHGGGNSSNGRYDLTPTQLSKLPFLILGP